MEPTYLLKRYEIGDTVEIQKTISWRYGRNVTRGEWQAPTPVSMAEYNRRQSYRELTRRINANFTPQDLYATLTYRRGLRPDPTQAKKNLTTLLRKFRTLFKKKNQELRYIWVTAYGERGAIHHHLVISGIDIRELCPHWPHGGVHAKPLYQDGEYSGLAYYMVYQCKEGPGGEMVKGRNWNSSRNLHITIPKVREVEATRWREPPKPEPGYYIQPDSIDASSNPLTGAPSLFYRMIKIPPHPRQITPDGILLKDDAAARWLREENVRAVKEKWMDGTIKPLEVKKHGKKRGNKKVQHLRP